jgi:simple sugar transport system permease protein
MKGLPKRLSRYQSFWPLMVLLAILLINGIASGGSFFAVSVVDGHLYGRIIDILRNGSKLMLLAIGMTMVMATGGTDISVGSVMAIAATLACSNVNGSLLPGLGGSVAAAIAVSLCVGLLCGLWNGFLVSKVKIQPIVATMILMTAGRGIAQLISGGQIPKVNSDAYYFINGGYVLGLPFPIFIVAFFLAGVLLLTQKTAFGMFVEATGVNSRSSWLAGINVGRVKLIIYTFSGLMAAMAGLVESSGVKSADANNMGLMIEMDAILAIALGGTSLAGGRFSIPASVIGALIIQSITTTVYALGVAPQITQVVKSLVVIAICLAQSREFQARVLRRLRPRKEGAAL